MWYFPHFTDEETETQRSNLSKVKPLETQSEYRQYHGSSALKIFSATALTSVTQVVILQSKRSLV